MRFSLERIDELFAKGNLTQIEEVELNILNFIHTIILNGYDFIDSAYDSEYFDDLAMKFLKHPGQASGIVVAKLRTGKRIYVFNDRGFDPIEDLMALGKN